MGDINREGHRQTALGVDVTRKDACDGLAAVRARIPRLGNAGDLILPRHGHRAARFQDDGDMLVYLGQGLNQGVLTCRQVNVWHILAFGFPLRGENDDDIALFRQGFSRRDVLAFDKGELAGRKP